MRLKLTANEEMRTAIVRIKSNKHRAKLFSKIYDYKHFENILLILIKQNYDLAQSEQAGNDFALLSSYQVMRAVIRNTNGGKHKEKADYIKKNYKDHPLMKSLIEVGQNLKIHNLAMIINRVKGNFKSFFSHIKQNHQNPKPPRPKKLSKLTRFSIPLDVNSWSFKRENKLGINLCGKMFYIYLRHDKLEEVVSSLNNIQSVFLQLSNNDLYLSISYRHHRTFFPKMKEKAAGIDLGVNNLAALVIKDQKSKSLIVSGSNLKHYNSCFNRFVGKINNSIDSLKNQLKKQDDFDIEKRLHHLQRFRSFLYQKRNLYFYDQFHKISTRILEYLQLHNVTDLFCSSNIADLKNNGKCLLRKDAKQNFIQIPLLQLFHYLKYKSRDYGINFYDVDEAYTSKTSSLSANILHIQKISLSQSISTNDLKGSRVKRGLFRDFVTKQCINADLNAALNIIKVGLSQNFAFAKQLLFKLCNPITVKSDRDLFCLIKTIPTRIIHPYDGCHVVSL